MTEAEFDLVFDYISHQSLLSAQAMMDAHMVRGQVCVVTLAQS